MVFEYPARVGDTQPLVGRSDPEGWVLPRAGRCHSTTWVVLPPIPRRLSLPIGCALCQHVWSRSRLAVVKAHHVVNITAIHNRQKELQKAPRAAKILAGT